MDVLEAWFCEPLMEICMRGMRETGKLPIKEVWVNRQIYDGLSDLLIKKYAYRDTSDEKQSEWRNGLIVIQTPGGAVTIRLAEA